MYWVDQDHTAVGPDGIENMDHSLSGGRLTTPTPDMVADDQVRDAMQLLKASPPDMRERMAWESIRKLLFGR